MNSQDIQKHIDRTVGTEGTLRIPAWWMHKILSDLVQYCDTLKSSDGTIKEYIEDQLNLIGDAIEALDARLSTVESHELFAIVSELPSEPKANTIYLVPSANGEGNNILTEWVYVNGAWEQFGEFKADVDLSGYVKKEDIDSALSTTSENPVMNKVVTEEFGKNPFEKGHGTYSAVLKGHTNKAEGLASTAFGRNTTANDECCHAEGHECVASGHASHAEGQVCQALNNQSHAEGYGTIANGDKSHTEGYGTIANNQAEHAEGKFNISSANTIHSVGIGSSDANRKNAHEIHKNGKHYILGIGGYDGTNPDQAKDLKTVLEEKADKSDIANINAKPMVSVTYAELVTLRDNGELIAGMQYRITDYVTTTAQENTQSAGHQFDVIVTADNENTLNEVARACLHEGDTYFSAAGANLAAWKIWYSLDNDTERFAWASDKEILDSTECSIKSDLVAGNAFKNPMPFSYLMWNDPTDGEIYESSKLESDLIYEYGYETEPNGNDSLYLVKSDASIYEDEGVDYQDKFYYRGIEVVDGVEYDCWQKAEYGNYMGNNMQGPLFALTERIVEGNIVHSVSGKGVIYRMIDEFGNDCPYDFKNIMFVRYELEAPETIDDEHWLAQLSANIQARFKEGQLAYLWGGLAKDADRYWEDDWTSVKSTQTGNSMAFFTFSNVFNGVVSDKSLTPQCYKNNIGVWSNGDSEILSNNIFFSINKNSSCYSNSFGNSCYYNSFGNDCSSNSFGNDCSSNSFGNDCYSNSFGDDCYSNSFGNNCSYNSFGNNCSYNSFGNNCSYNSFGNDCSSNSFGNDCYYNSFGNSCYYNSFGNDCYYNSFGNSCYSNSFGNNCSSNSFGNDSQSNELRAFYRHITLGEGVQYVTLENEENANSGNQVQNYRIANGTQGEGGNPLMVNVERNTSVEYTIAKNSDGEVKVFCLADLIQ